MTTPAPPGGNLPAIVGSNLLGGGSGTLGGTNQLQQSLDSLTRAVTALDNRLSNTNFGGGSGAMATRQQGQTQAMSFPKMLNQFQPQGGGSGSNIGGGNITPTASFSQMSTKAAFAGGAAGIGLGTVMSSLSSFGQNMMVPQLTLNQYATQSMMGLNFNGMSRNQAMQALYSQVGATPGRLNALAMNPMDAIGMAYPLQMLGGTQILGQSSLGSAGLAAAAGFGISNPTLGATTSAQLAAALYSPQFSMNMLQLGYRNTIRSMNGGNPASPGAAAQMILSGMGLGKMGSAQVFGNLASPKGQANISALFGPSGIGNQQATQFLQTYAQLFSKGYSASSASNLIQQAAFGSTSQMKSAQQQLNRAGVATATSDIQALKNAQSVLTGRQGDYAAGFGQGLQDATGALEEFNNALNNILNGPLGRMTGYGGGFGGIMAGTQGTTAIAGNVGLLMLGARALGLGGGSAAGGAAGAGAATGAAGGALAPIIAAAVPVVGGMLIGAAVKAVGDKLSPSGSSAGGISSVMQSQHMLPLGMGPFAGIIGKLGSWAGGLLHIGGMGGGAASVSTSQQQRTGGSNQLGGISGSAKSAVSAAESQVGVPYVWGDEIPGVGFDCSGLVQWAYKQAGVGLPRTSQEMWSALKSRRVGLNQVQEGDLLFTAGSDGTATSPGHVAMMINGHQLIQAPYTGADVQIIGYDPKAWTGAARPSGSGAFTSGGAGSGPQISGNTSSSLFAGNTGLGGPSTGAYGSAEEVDLINAMGAGMGMGMSLIGSGSNGSSGSNNTNTSSAGGTATIPKGKSAIVAMARKIAQQYGWASGLQWNDFVDVVNAESGWNVSATNPQSGAYGIPQALPGSKMSSAGSDWRTNPATQLKWMFGYIKGRYGTPANAWEHEQQYHWYGSGGMLSPGFSIVGERGPELAMTSGGKTQIFSNSQTTNLINALKGNVPQNPWKTDITSGSPQQSSNGSPVFNINFNPGSIQINAGNTHGSSIASNAGREVARQIVNHVNREATSQAIRAGDKL